MKTLLTNGFKAELRRKTEIFEGYAKDTLTVCSGTNKRHILVDKSMRYQSELNGYISAMDDSELFTDEELNGFYDEVHEFYRHADAIIETFPRA